jgi:hypothetical protein
MFTTRNLTRLAVGGSAIAIATVVALGVAAPAFAEDPVQVSLGGLSSSLAAGGQRDGFTVSLKNKTNQAYVGVVRVFTVTLPGLQVGGVRIFRGFGQELQQEQTGPGQVRLTDPQQAELLPAGQRGNNRSANFFIQFMNNAPLGQAQIAVQAIASGQTLGTDSDSINVRAFGGSTRTSHSSTPPPTSSVPPATFQAQSPASPLATVQDPQVAAANASGKGAPWILYVLGGILVAAGGAILWLLFRTPRSDYVDLPTGAHEPIRPMGLGYPSNVRPSTPQMTAPTRIMPAVPGPYQQPQPPPASDPWAGPSDGPTVI